MLEETLDQGTFVNTHQISKDGTYIILGYTSLKLYIRNNYDKCNIAYCTKCLNSTHCEHCNELVDYYLNQVTGSC